MANIPEDCLKLAVIETKNILKKTVSRDFSSPVIFSQTLPDPTSRA
jgi:hypothetical protein